MQINICNVLICIPFSNRTSFLCCKIPWKYRHPLRYSDGSPASLYFQKTNMLHLKIKNTEMTLMSSNVMETH